MTAGAQVRSLAPPAGRPRPVPGRLLRLELRRSAMLWMMPVAAVLSGRASAGRFTAVLTEPVMVVPCLAFAACCGLIVLYATRAPRGTS